MRSPCPISGKRSSTADRLFQQRKCIQSDLNERALPYRSYRARVFQYNADKIPKNISLFVIRSGWQRTAPIAVWEATNNVVADTRRWRLISRRRRENQVSSVQSDVRIPDASIGSMARHRLDTTEPHNSLPLRAGDSETLRSNSARKATATGRARVRRAEWPVHITCTTTWTKWRRGRIRSSTRKLTSTTEREISRSLRIGEEKSRCTSMTRWTANFTLEFSTKFILLLLDG
jgi:hypothetical protein